MHSNIFESQGKLEIVNTQLALAALPLRHPIAPSANCEIIGGGVNRPLRHMPISIYDIFTHGSAACDILAGCSFSSKALRKEALFILDFGLAILD